MQHGDIAKASTSISQKLANIAKASTSISQKLANLPIEETKCYIYRVYDHLRNLNPRAYAPQILAIGPYHHGKGTTKLMEKHKLLYLKSLLQKKNQTVYTCLLAIEEIERKARSCYVNSIKFTPAKFVEMMLLDGCFIIELLLRKNEDRNSMQGDPIFETEWMLSSIQRDLMLFENQIPFFVLCKLFNLVESSVSNYQTLLGLILGFFKSSIPGAGYRMPTNTRMENADDIKHLLHLIHVFWSPDSLDTSHQIPVDENPDSLDTSHQKPVDEKPWRFVSAVTKLICSPASLDKSHKKPADEKPWPFVRAVTKLRNANMKFGKNDKEGASLFDITFENGTLKLPHLQIDDGTEDLFRNLIAYEQYFPKREQHNFATDYATFLDKLIDSPGDVEILCKRGILGNWLGSAKVVSNIFNKLTDSVGVDLDNFSYAGVCDDMNKHCKKRRNNWMAKLRRNHLGSPWAILSLIAGVVLLLLTAVQSVCSILQL